MEKNNRKYEAIFWIFIVAVSTAAVFTNCRLFGIEAVGLIKTFVIAILMLWMPAIFAIEQELFQKRLVLILGTGFLLSILILTLGNVVPVYFMWLIGSVLIAALIHPVIGLMFQLSFTCMASGLYGYTIDTFLFYFVIGGLACLLIVSAINVKTLAYVEVITLSCQIIFLFVKDNFSLAAESWQVILGNLLTLALSIGLIYCLRHKVKPMDDIPLLYVRQSLQPEDAAKDSDYTGMEPLSDAIEESSVTKSHRMGRKPLAWENGQKETEEDLLKGAAENEWAGELVNDIASGNPDQGDLLQDFNLVTDSDAEGYPSNAYVDEEIYEDGEDRYQDEDFSEVGTAVNRENFLDDVSYGGNNSDQVPNLDAEEGEFSTDDFAEEEGEFSTDDFAEEEGGFSTDDFAEEEGGFSTDDFAEEEGGSAADDYTEKAGGLPASYMAGEENSNVTSGSGYQEMDLESGGSSHGDTEAKTIYDQYLDPSHPLLKRLKEELPQTYKHSLLVSLLSEKAAAILGANSILCKAGAMYHEVGKLSEMKEYKEAGVRMLQWEEYPEDIVKIVEEHSGKESIPTSKESAIVMLTDNVVTTIRYFDRKEAAKKPSRRKIIDNIFVVRMEQGYLDDAGFNLGEYKTLKDFFETNIPK